MLKVAITGNIASGKTTVEKFLKEKSYKVLDTDEVAHSLLKDRDVKKEIASNFFGFDIFEKSASLTEVDSDISRSKLGKIIFGNENLRKKLESILHPKIKEEIARFFNNNEKQGEKIAFVSVPLLFEAKFENHFDKIILIYSDDKIRLERLVSRDNLPLEYAENRLKIQISQDKKTSLADYVIYNNKTLNDLRNNLDEALKLL